MKANELMIGDWVLFSGELKRVKSIVVSDNGVERIYVFGNTCQVSTINAYIQPIPLTPEILEKNGFVHYEEDEESFHNEDCVFIKQNLGGYGVCLDKNRTVSGLFHYVHELQHALKLCGIEKTIEL